MQQTLSNELNKILNLPVTVREIEDYYRSCAKRGSLKTGLEYERISVDSRTYENANYSMLSEIIKSFALVNEWQIISDSNIIVGAEDGFSSISLEPGGQFELSVEPKASLNDLYEDLNFYLRRLDKIGEYYNIAFLPYGLNPKTTYPHIAVLKKQRYLLMADYLPKIGRLAPVMMRETAGVQVNLDYQSEEDALFKLKTAAYMSPFITGFYANSPIRGDKLTGYKSFRALAWKYTGFDRCNLFYHKLINSRMGQGFEDYIKAIIDVPMLYIEREGRKIPIMGKMTFREYMEKGFEGNWASLNDYLLHSSLTFPDVRLKNCLEIRNHDSQRSLGALSICALYKGILYSKDACYEVMDLLKPLNSEDLEVLGYSSAKYGLDYMVDKLKLGAYDVAKRLFEIARKHLPDIEKDYLDKPLWILKNRKCVADIILEKGIYDTQSLIEYTKDSL